MAARAALVVAAAGLGAAACGSVASPLPGAAGPLPPPRRAALTVPGPSSSQAPGCGDLYASPRPRDPLPRPGAMPAGSTMKAIVDRGYLTVAVRPDTPPFATVDVDTGQFEGFEIDLAQAIGRALFGADGHVRFRAVTAAERLSVVQSGQVDLAIATVTVTCERKAQVAFSTVYFQASKDVLVRDPSPYHSLADLGGRKVCAAAGTTSLQRIVDTPSHPVPYPVANVTDCLVALQQGAVDGIVNDNTVLSGMAAQDPYTHIVGPTGLDVPTAIALNKNHPDLNRFVDGVLHNLEADGTWTRLYNRWLRDTLGPPPPLPPEHYQG